MTEAANEGGEEFVVTREHRRFAEFCDACQQYRYIGVCHGPPGVGKTLAARHYARWDMIEAYDPYRDTDPETPSGLMDARTVFYTPAVVSSPRQIDSDLHRLRERLLDLRREPLRREHAAAVEAARRREEEWRASLYDRDWLSEPSPPAPEPSYSQIAYNYANRRQAVADPTRLIVIDETDRLNLTGLEQIRDIYDRGRLGVILIGMPGLEKRLSRYPQLYSRVGFVHEFRQLKADEVRELLQRWTPAEVVLPEHGLSDPEAVTAIVRITGGTCVSSIAGSLRWHA
jgi:hypothetical protein